MSENEVMHTSSTGATKAGNDERYSLIPARSLQDLAGFYGSRGSLEEPAIATLYYHLWEFWNGEDLDESGYPQVIAAAYHCFQLVDGQTSRYESPGGGWERIPQEPLRLLAKHYGVGAKKYDDRNWEKGYKWSLTFDAANRHLRQHVTGELIDAETGTPHLICTAWHCFALAEYMHTHPEFDDRSKPPEVNLVPGGGL